MRKKIILPFCLYLLISPILSAMKVSGELKIAAPVDIYIEDIQGKVLFHISLKQSGSFSTADVSISPDIYTFKINESKEYVFFDNTDVTIHGFLDADNPENSQLEFSGIQSNEVFQVLQERYSASKGSVELLASLFESGKATAPMISALVYLNPLKAYEDYKAVLDILEGEKPENSTYHIVEQKASELFRYRIGGPAYDFKVVDSEKNKVQLSDFRGKYVLLDFWASWCGPCKAEIKKIAQFYPEFRDKEEIVFISISLDETKEKWEQGLETTTIPWISLWDEEGKGFTKTPLKEEYGFRSIPFLLLIDKEGNVMARNLRGHQIKNKLIELNISR